MALINDPNITAQIRDLANTGTIDSNQIVSILQVDNIITMFIMLTR